jgi:hypothetical protein
MTSFIFERVMVHTESEISSPPGSLILGAIDGRETGGVGGGYCGGGSIGGNCRGLGSVKLLRGMLGERIVWGESVGRDFW